MITKLVTARAHLPQGFATSPSLANLIFTRVDARIAGFCERLGFRYTRYGDDLTVSGRHMRRNAIIHTIREIIEDSGFTVNEEKFKASGIQPATRRQQVLGITINKKRSLPREKRQQFQRDIIELNRALEAGDTETSESLWPVVRGRINYAKQVCLLQGLGFENKLCEELRPEESVAMITDLWLKVQKTGEAKRHRMNAKPTVYHHIRIIRTNLI